MDLDCNGVITGYELEYFYEEQSQRLNYMESNLDFNFENIVCQMVDASKGRAIKKSTNATSASRSHLCSTIP